MQRATAVTGAPHQQNKRTQRSVSEQIVGQCYERQAATSKGAPRGRAPAQGGMSAHALFYATHPSALLTNQEQATNTQANTCR